MDELIELLNEHSKTRKYNNAEIVEWVEHTKGNLYWRYWENSWSYMVVISKEYGFIQRLVENEKIDRDKIIEKSDFMPIVSDKFGDFLQPTEEQELLMLLAIQENPIEFLCSVLK